MPVPHKTPDQVLWRSKTLLSWEGLKGMLHELFTEGWATGPLGAAAGVGIMAAAPHAATLIGLAATAVAAPMGSMAFLGGAAVSGAALAVGLITAKGLFGGGLKGGFKNLLTRGLFNLAAGAAAGAGIALLSSAIAGAAIPAALTGIFTDAAVALPTGHIAIGAVSGAAISLGLTAVKGVFEGIREGKSRNEMVNKAIHRAKVEEAMEGKGQAQQISSPEKSTVVGRFTDKIKSRASEGPFSSQVKDIVDARER